jgi:hypothetical protein
MTPAIFTQTGYCDARQLRHAPPALRAPVHCWPLHRRSMTLRRRSRLIPARFAPVAEDIWLSSRFSLAGPSPGHHQILPTHPGEWRREPARPEAKPGSMAHSVQPKKNAGRARPTNFTKPAPNLYPARAEKQNPHKQCSLPAGSGFQDFRTPPAPETLI